MYWRILNDQPFWTRPNDRMFMLDKVAKSNSQNKTNWYLFKLEPDSTRFSQEPTEKGQTLKGNRQSSQATHCLVKKYAVPSVTSFRTDLPRDSTRRNGWPKHKLRIVVSFVTIVQSRSRNVLSRVLRRCRLSQSLVFPLVCFTRKRLWLVSDSKINQVSSGVLGNWGNWSSCCSVRIDRRLLSHQLILLMFDTSRCWPTCVSSCCSLCASSSIQITATFQSTHGDSLVPQSQQQAPPPCADVRLNGAFLEPLKMGGSSHSL